MGNLKRLSKMDCSGGMQTRTTNTLALNSQLKHALNAEFSSKLGAATGRRGSKVLSTVVASQRILTILQWIKNDGTVKYFASVSDGVEVGGKVDLFKNSEVLSGEWSKSMEDLTDAVDVFAVNFINQLIACNGVDTVKGFNGVSWLAITNAPAAGKFPEVYRQQLHLLTESGFLHSSDVINATGDGFTTDVWTNRGINPNDGQKCKMMKRHRNRLVIFKEESIYRYDGTNEPEAVITVGTHSGKSVVILGDIYFHHPTGIYKMGAGDPVIISRGVKKFLDGMSSANWSQVAASRDLENVYFWIGDVTIDDPLEHDYEKTYPDVVLVYNVYAQNWTAYSGWGARTWFYDETSGLTYFGTSTGKIVQINTGYADIDGETISPISFEIIFMPEDYGYPEREKEFGNINVIGQYDSDILVAEDYNQLVTMKKLNQERSGGSPTCKQLWVGVSEEYSARPPRVEGLILDNVNLLDSVD